MSKKQQLLHYENMGVGGMLIKRPDGYRWYCPDCGTTGTSKRIRKTCPACRNKKGEP